MAAEPGPPAAVLGTAIAGTILVAGLSKGAYAAAMSAHAVIALGGLVAAAFLPRRAAPTAASATTPEPAPAGTT